MKILTKLMLALPVLSGLASACSYNIPDEDWEYGDIDFEAFKQYDGMPPEDYANWVQRRSSGGSNHDRFKTHTQEQIHQLLVEMRLKSFEVADMFIESGSSYNIKIMGALQLLQRADELEKRVSNHINLHADDIHAFSSSRALVSKAEVLTREVEEAIVKAESKGQRDSELQHFKNILNELKKHKEEPKPIDLPKEENATDPTPSAGEQIAIREVQINTSIEVSIKITGKDLLVFFILIIAGFLVVLIPGNARDNRASSDQKGTREATAGSKRDHEKSEQESKHDGEVTGEEHVKQQKVDEIKTEGSGDWCVVDKVGTGDDEVAFAN